MKFLNLLVLAVALSFTSLFADEIPTYQLLSERRPTLVFPNYSVEEKKLVLDQVKMVLKEIFVHRDLKIKDFGPSADPLPAISEIEKNIENISTYEFHKKIAEIIFSQHDFHTSYNFPKPYACYRSLIPINIKEVVDLNGQKVMAVSGITENADIMKLMPEDFRIELGDTLVSYNGIPVREAMLKMAERSKGANAAAILAQTANLLTYIRQNSDVAPANDKVVLTLKDRSGHTYTNTVPWVSIASPECLKPTTTPAEDLANFNMRVGANEYQIELTKLFRKHHLNKSLTDADGLKDTIEPILKYKKLSNEYGTFGFFRLESFAPEKTSIDEVVFEFKRLLKTEFAHTTGIIIDLRDNGGGMIDLADKLVQLFTANNVASTNFHLKNSPANLYYMDTYAPESPFTKALHVAIANNTINTTDLPLSDYRDINSLGQYFFRPVTILTNSSCYSSCDMFSAQMQDHGAGVIFGEDANTGAGGANNYNLNAIYAQLPEGKKGPFKQLPYGQNIGFAFRQSVRVGLHKGELLEDKGVIADQMAEPSVSDLFNFSENQIKILSKEINRTVGAYTSWAIVANDERMDIPMNSSPVVFAKWGNTTSIEFKMNGNNIGTETLELNNSTGRNVDVPNLIKSDSYQLGNFEMVGFINSKRAWRKVVNFRVILTEFNLISSEGLIFDFNNGMPVLLQVYNEHTALEDGWVSHDGVLSIGLKETYKDDVHSEISTFITLPANPLTLNFEASIDTEVSYDFFKVSVVSAGVETQLLQPTSGKLPMKNYTYDLTAYAGKNIELRFDFTSDGGINDKGISIRNLSLK